MLNVCCILFRCILYTKEFCTYFGNAAPVAIITFSALFSFLEEYQLKKTTTTTRNILLWAESWILHTHTHIHTPVRLRGEKWKAAESVFSNVPPKQHQNPQNHSVPNGKKKLTVDSFGHTYIQTFPCTRVLECCWTYKLHCRSGHALSYYHRVCSA